jgi:hypothetical protein
VYVDAIDWVELPNVAGMALYANGGRFTSKPYIARRPVHKTDVELLRRLLIQISRCAWDCRLPFHHAVLEFTFRQKHEKTLVKKSAHLTHG